MPSRLANAAAAVLLAVPLLASGCADRGGEAVGGTVSSNAPVNGEPGYLTGFIGAVVADEPRAATVGRDVLSAGGTAVDAAVALGFALSVTLPSRAGLGGGGGCIVYAPSRGSPNKGQPEAVLFVPPPGSKDSTADRPAAVPMLARGLYAMHAKYGERLFTSLIAPAENMARDGIPTPRALARDLAVVAGPLSADPAASLVFLPHGQPLAEGAQFLQPGLAATLGQLRAAGVGDLYQGGLAHVLVDAGRDAGAGLSLADLRGALPTLSTPLTLPIDAATVAFLPPPADGGLAAAAALQVLQRDAKAQQAAGDRALAVASQWRRSGGDAKSILASTALPEASLPALPASTTFATLDRRGNAVVCALTMNNLFGTGRIAAGTGMLLAASPAAAPPALLSAAIAYDAGERRFRAAVGGSGQTGAPLAAAVALRAALADTGATARPATVVVPEPGRANIVQCNRGLPGEPASCGWATDSRGAGAALGTAP
jgi:gamma-glutamyltranspeptidase / glutathione hydrolase